MTKLSGMRVFLKPVHDLQTDQRIERDRNIQQQQQRQPPAPQCLETDDGKVTSTSTPTSVSTFPKAVLLNSTRFQQQQQQRQQKTDAKQQVQQVQQLEQPGGPIRFKAEEFMVPVRKRGPRPGALPATGVSRYVLNRNVVTVWDVLTEWRYGIEGGPAIQDLQTRMCRRVWGVEGDTYAFTVRACIVEAFVKEVMEDGRSEEETIKRLERLRKRRLSSIYGAILEEREQVRRSRQ